MLITHRQWMKNNNRKHLKTAKHSQTLFSLLIFYIMFLSSRILSAPTSKFNFCGWTLNLTTLNLQILYSPRRNCNWMRILNEPHNTSTLTGLVNERMIRLKRNFICKMIFSHSNICKSGGMKSVGRKTTVFG